MTTAARERAWQHLLRTLGHPSGSAFLAADDAGQRLGPLDAPWVLEFGRARADRTITEVGVEVRLERGGSVPHVRLRIDEDLLGWVGDHLTLGHDGPRDELGRPTEADGRAWARPWVDLVLSGIRRTILETAVATGVDWVELDRWPQDRPYALALSHDIDSLFEREPFALVHNAIGIVKPERDMIRSRAEAARRFARSALRPTDPLTPIGALLDLEQELGITATSFFLLDERWSRHGARYHLGQRAVRAAIDAVLEAGHEVGIHTGTSYFADPERLSSWVEKLRSAGAPVESIRGHYLCFDHELSFANAAAAGIRSDSTYGLPAFAGFRAGTGMPFLPPGAAVMELPLTLMDVSHFREAQPPRAVAERLLDDTRSVGGLLSVLWHNSYVGVPEYVHVEELLGDVLRRAHADGAWLPSTRDARRWLDTRDAVVLRLDRRALVVHAPAGSAVGLRVTGRAGTRHLSVDGGEQRIPLSWMPAPLP